MSYFSERDEVISLLQKCEKLVAKGQLRQSDEQLEAALQRIDQDSALYDLIPTVQNLIEKTKAQVRPQIEEARDWLDQSLVGFSAGGAFDFERAEQMLVQLENADLSGAYTEEIQNYRNKVGLLVARQRIGKKVKDVVDRCEELWQQAEKLATGERPLAPATLLRDYYEKALALAHDACSSYPDDPNLKQLVQEAETRRENKALAAQIYTSAVQGELFHKALNDLELVKPGQTVPRYKFVEDAGGVQREQYDGEVSVEVAREDLRSRAHRWAIKKKQEYLGNATKLLGQKDPLAARTVLEDRVKIDEFLEPGDRAEFQALEKQLNEELVKLGNAERRARQAQDELARDPLGAWQIYQQASGIYATAPSLEGVRQAILEALNHDLLAMIRQAETAFGNKDIEGVQALYDRAQRDYADKDITLDTKLSRLSVVAQEARDYIEKLALAQKQLEAIKQILDMGDTQAALAQLDLLEQFPRLVLDSLTELNDLRSRIESSSDADTTYDRLQKLLDLNEDQIAQVRRGVSSAAEWCEQHPDDGRFEQLYSDLRLHLAFLEARRELSVGHFDRALDLLKPLQSEPRHRDNSDALELIDLIYEQKRTSEDLQKALDQAEESLRSQPGETYRDLALLEIRDAVQMARRNELLARAKRTWLDQIEKAFSAWDEQPDILFEDVREIESSLDALRTELEKLSRYGYWQKKLGGRIAASKAAHWMQAGIANHDERLLGDAVEQWRMACSLTQGSRFAARELEEYQSELLSALKQRAELQVEQVANLATDLGDDVEAHAHEVQEMLEDLSNQYPRDAQIMLLRAKLAGIMALSNDKVQVRNKNFQEMGKLARRTAELPMVNPEVKEQARELIAQAKIGDQLAIFMQQVEELMRVDKSDKTEKASVRDITRAKEIWTREISPKSAGEFELLETWWNRLRESTLKALRAHAGSADSLVRFEHIRYLAMVYVLDREDKRARAMFEQLPRLIAGLRSEAQDIVERAPTAEGVTGGSVETTASSSIRNLVGEIEIRKLRSQRTRAHEVLEELDSIAQLSILFGDFASSQEDSDIQKILHAISQDIEGDIRALHTTCNELDQLHDDIQAIQLSLAEEARSRDFSASRQILSRHRARFGQHPTYQYVEKQIINYEQRLQETEIQLDQIRKLIRSESYLQAYREMEKVPLEYLKRFGLLEDFSFLDPERKAAYQGWDEVKEFVDRNSVQLRIIADFAAPFNAEPLTGEASTVHVVDWPARQQKIRQMISQGRFADARVLLDDVLHGTDQENLSLDKAIAHLSDPPFPSETPREEIAKADTVEKSYRLAIAYAVRSEYWKKILKYLWEQCWTLYKKWQAEANNLYAMIEDAQNQWREGWESWRDAIRDIGVHFADAGGIKGSLKKKQKREIQAALERADVAYQSCWEACDAHPRLKEMSNLWLYQEAARRTSHSSQVFSLGG